MFSKKNHNDSFSDGEEQLKWLEEELVSANGKHRFILMMHILPGMSWFGYREDFWQENFTDKFLSILSEHRDNISFLIGGHMHFAELRVQQWPKMLGLLSIQSPSVSPVYYNQPGYSVLDIDEDTGKILNYEIRYF